ncbi:Fe-S cluster assembly protein SufD [Allopusillimonas ginsengisoli]|nr:Fe-S cluster assembly protein SufD [Allopusillimonas ginsengisoli]
MSSVETWAQTFATRGANLPGAQLPWLAARRKQAIERFAAEGWPTSKNDEWRHTSLATLAQQAFLDADGAATAGVQRPYSDDDKDHWLVFVDGKYMPALSRVGDLPAGVTIEPLSRAFTDTPESLEALYGSDTDGASTVALNLALASDGAYVSLASGTIVEQPIHLVFMTASKGSASFTRNLVQAGAGAQATIMEHFVGQGAGASFTNTVTRMNLDADAHVTHLKLQREDAEAFHLGVIDVQQGKSSVFNSHSMSFGARLARHDIATAFGGDHCQTLLNGLYYVDGKRHVDHHTLISHDKPFGTSHEYYRGVLGDTARGVFRGRIFVAPGADKTDAVQRSDSLLLSRLAKADARPELEIYADDVKCAHGATVGQIDADSLFYLRSRGLDEELARHVLTYAFAAEAIARIESDLLRQRVIGAIQALAPENAALGDFA